MAASIEFVHLGYGVSLYGSHFTTVSDCRSSGQLTTLMAQSLRDLSSFFLLDSVS